VDGKKKSLPRPYPSLPRFQKPQKPGLEEGVNLEHRQNGLLGCTLLNDLLRRGPMEGKVFSVRSQAIGVVCRWKEGTPSDGSKDIEQKIFRFSQARKFTAPRWKQAKNKANFLFF